MKFNLTESERERILNLHMDKGYRKPINEDLLPSDLEYPQPHHPEDFVEIDYDSTNETVVLYFNDETTETFNLKLKTYFSAGEPSSYDSPGYGDTFEVEIVGVKQVEPVQKDWEPNRFERYLESLGAMEQLNDALHSDEAYESAADRQYDSGYDEDAYRDRDLDEDLMHPDTPEEPYFIKHGGSLSRAKWSSGFDPETGQEILHEPNHPLGLDDYDDYSWSSYKDFDSMHAEHPEMYRHYIGRNERPTKRNLVKARKTFDSHLRYAGPVNIMKKRKGINEDYDVAGNAAQMYDMEKNKMLRALNELDENIKKGDTEMSLHLTFVLRHLLRRIDESVNDLKK